jgi:hypothetical protein
MNVATIIRRAVRKVDRALEGAQEDIYLYRWQSEDDFGAPVYADVEILKGFHSDYVRTILQGTKAVQTRHKVRFLSNVTIDMRDRVEVSVPPTIENPSGRSTGPIVDIRGNSDPTGGRFFTTVILGA